MATAEQYADWIVKNQDKRGTPEFDTVASAYKLARGSVPPESPVVQAPEKPFGQKLNENIADIPRQIGLTARVGIQGLGNAVGLLSDPIAGTLNAATGSKFLTAGALAERLANSAGLPQPANATERVVGDVAGMMATAGPIAKGSQLLSGTVKGMGNKALAAMGANPGMQVASAASAGGAGGYVRETGGNDGAQFAAALAGGVAAPFAMNKGQQLASAGNRLVQRMTTPQVAQPQQIDTQINQALQPSGLTLDQLPMNIQNGIRADVQQALRADGVLSPDALRRLADYRLAGATPTAGTLTLDPATVSQQKNLAKIGINSKDEAAQQLGRVENENNRLLIGGLNDLGANTPLSARAGGQRVMDALAERNERAQSLINERYARARASDGRSAALDPSAFTNRANDLLDNAMVGGNLPSDVRNLLNRAARGEMPLTVDVAEQFKTRIGALQRASTEPAQRMALGLVRQALDDTPLLDGQGQQAINAFNRARRLNAAWMRVVEETPALQAVRDGIEPDKFVQQFIVGNGSKTNVADLQALRRSVQSSPEAMAAVREQIAAYLKGKALGGAADEVGNFSQSAFNKALNAIGDEKLAMFFTREQANQLRAIGRVASYEQFQPKGAAVNNSNTAGTAAAALLDRIGNSPLLQKIPFGNALAQPAQNISIGIGAQRAMSVPNALIAPRIAPQRSPNRLMLSPAAFLTAEDRK